ncbi:MAG: PEP-CTERM sorting domain-containing protein [Opitutales bacterium]|nr:PEP-CTERM sorting domain-containing protein [Opitutales bacterium]
MKNIITTALLCAVAVSANAAWTETNKSKIWMQDTADMTYTYSNESTVSLVPSNGGLSFWESQGQSEVNVHFDNSVKVDFTKDARYELTFRVSFFGQPNNGGYTYCNLSMVTSGNDASILFGNAANNVCQLGIVVGKDVTATSAQESLCANSAGNQKYSTTLTKAAAAGFYTYKLIFETFADSSITDKIYFGVTNEGTGETGQFLILNSSHLGLGGANSKVFDDIGFHIFGADFLTEGGTEVASGQGGVKLLRDGSTLKTWTRTATPVPQPNVPEPAAFGLLAGLGAIVLAASRRRRSR